jgi:thiamine kinase-like enzyme
MKYKPKKAFKLFDVDSEVVKLMPLKRGHINDTYIVKTAGERNFILQRINHEVFEDVPGMQQNIHRVTSHVRKKLKELGEENIDKKVLTLVRAKDNNLYAEDDDGNFWRVYYYIEGTRSYDIVETKQQAYKGGKAFGRFQKLLADIKGGPLNETIPQFHDVDMRLGNFDAAVEKNPVNRITEIRDELRFVNERRKEMRRIKKLGGEGLIPKRITHNDTKFNNVLFDKNGKPLCIVDLDTVMSGYVHFDFGDAIRTATNTAAEDEKDLDLVGMDFELFKAYTEGYLSEAHDFLNETEMANLAFSARFMTFLIGLRFLTDYIDGDNYFKINYPDHNLIRARVQFKLVDSIEKQREDMENFVESIS